MRKIGKIYLSFFILISVAIFSSCENEPLEGEFGYGPENPGEGENPEDPNNPAVFQVEINEVNFVGSTVEATINEDGLQIAAQEGSETFGLQIFEPQVGSFDLSNENNGMLIYTPDVNSEEYVYSLSEGTVVITDIDYDTNTISGTFEGTLTEWAEQAEEITLTNGIFENIPFSQEEPEDYATAVIDGEDFNANTFSFGGAGDQISLNFHNDLNQQIVLHMNLNEIAVGAFPIGGMGDDFSASYSPSSSGETYNSIPESGTINITSFEAGIITGTFNFEAEMNGSPEETVSITNGTFSMDIN